MIGTGFFEGDTAGVALMVSALLVALVTVLGDWRPGQTRHRRDVELASARAKHPASASIRPMTRFPVSPPPLTRMTPVVVRSGRSARVRQCPEADA
jgi:hypothetical protein